jgi:hypothetical protein
VDLRVSEYDSEFIRRELEKRARANATRKRVQIPVGSPLKPVLDAMVRRTGVADADPQTQASGGSCDAPTSQRCSEPDPRNPAGPAVDRTAHTGRTHDRNRPDPSQLPKFLATAGAVHTWIPACAGNAGVWVGGGGADMLWRVDAGVGQAARATARSSRALFAGAVRSPVSISCRNIMRPRERRERTVPIGMPTSLATAS